MPQSGYSAAVPAWVAVHGVNAAGYQSFFDTQTAHGFVPVLVSATGTANDAVFAAVFEQGITGAWFARHGMTSGPEANVGTFQHQNKAAHDGKMILRSMAIYGTPSDRRFIGVWHANPGYTKWHVHYADDGADYQTVFNAETSNPFYRPTEVAVSMRPALLLAVQGRHGRAVGGAAWHDIGRLPDGVRRSRTRAASIRSRCRVVAAAATPAMPRSSRSATFLCRGTGT